MTLMSATCRLNEPGRLRPGHTRFPAGLIKPPPDSGPTGFTLLEIVVVMALLALISAIALPRLGTVYEGLRWAYERDEVLEKIADLGSKARKEGRIIELPPSRPEAEGLYLPEGWHIEVDGANPIRYGVNGACNGGQLRLSYGEKSVTLELRPPLCRPELP